MAAIATKRRISQETFDEAVKENMDDFDMSFEEALADAVEQFRNQGADLSVVVITKEGHEIMDKVKGFSSEFSAYVENGDVSKDAEQVVQGLDQIVQLCDESAETQVIALKEGVVGAAAFVVKLCVDDIATGKAHDNHNTLLIASFKALAALCKDNYESKEVLPRGGAEAICKCLADLHDRSDVVLAALALVETLMTKFEAKKAQFHELKFNATLIHLLEKNTENKDVFVAACKVLRRYIMDDDRRPGVQPNTFVRAREIGENPNCGVVAPLFTSLELMSNDAIMVGELCFTLRQVAVNDKICKNIFNRGSLEVALPILHQHITNPVVALHGSGFLRSVARTDSIKEAIGKGKGIGLLVLALENQASNPKVVAQVIGALSVLSLRMPENCERIGELGIIPLITKNMKMYPNDASLQRHSIMTLRNLVSSWKNKDLTQMILDEGAEDLINQAKNQHPTCNDVAFAALRDLGCKYEATYVSLSDPVQ